MTEGDEIGQSLEESFQYLLNALGYDKSDEAKLQEMREIFFGGACAALEKFQIAMGETSKHRELARFVGELKRNAKT